MVPDQYTDDTSIPDEAALWRRVPPWHLIFDENLGRIRPSKAAFDNDEDDAPMSVVLADIVFTSAVVQSTSWPAMRDSPWHP
jgi:hypothetical protein